MKTVGATHSCGGLRKNVDVNKRTAAKEAETFDVRLDFADPA
jgi:hypothetical protein